MSHILSSCQPSSSTSSFNSNNALQQQSLDTLLSILKCVPANIICKYDFDQPILDLLMKELLPSTSGPFLHSCLRCVYEYIVDVEDAASHQNESDEEYLLTQDNSVYEDDDDNLAHRIQLIKYYNAIQVLSQIAQKAKA